MSFPTTLSVPTERDVLIAFTDLLRFARHSRKLSDRETFALMDEHVELVAEIVEAAGGILVKAMGDSTLVVFDGADADAGVRALLEMKRRCEARLAEHGFDTEAMVKVHYGSAVCGEIGARGKKRFDLYGQAVNHCAMLATKGFALSPEAFRRLDKETRTLFKKHTPPVRYIPLDERHRD